MTREVAEMLVRRLLRAHTEGKIEELNEAREALLQHLAPVIEHDRPLT